MANNNEDGEGSSQEIVDEPTSSIAEEQIRDLMRIFRMRAYVANRSYLLKTYENVFVGKEAVDMMLKEFPSLKSRSEAVSLGRQFMHRGLFSHVVNEHTFKDKHLFIALM